MFKSKTLLITSGTGSFGNAVLNRFLDTDIKEIITQIEGRRLEFKETMPARFDFSKPVVAYANDAGGDI